MVIESLIRAIEARVPLDSKLSEQDRTALVKRDESEGFVLTGYFYNQLTAFEKQEAGLKDAFPDWLHGIDVAEVRKHAAGIQFASTAEPELLQATKPVTISKVDQAQRGAGQRESRGRSAACQSSPGSQ